MPSARYLLVEGVEGFPVVDPHNPAASPARYLGWSLRATPAVDPDHVLEHYEIVKQVVADHPEIRKAARDGHLRIHGTTVAKSHAAAAIVLDPPRRTTAPKES